MSSASYLSRIGVATIASLGLFTAVAAGAPDHHPSETSKAGKALHAKSENVRFEVEYENEEFYGKGMVKCVGRHQASEKLGYPGTETGGGRDIERCHTLDGKPFEKLTGGTEGEREFPGPANIWESDYFLLVKHESGVRTYDMKYEVAKNDRSFRLIAIYDE